MTTLYCAICERRFEPDTDHVEIDAEHVRMDDRNEIDDYVMHTRCWLNLTEGWVDPA
ncbi:hypothetical protein [Halosolutus gelatinilyticus]|uniref:hypothetical protein n=1 Tax=Halosolutus gelatinilyticus TaxID=2931975 RepID=UPI001FF34FAD|nr:hypothetical protein [Halosolutus gelatinilyticus]